MHAALAAVVALAPHAATADTVTVFGPEAYVRSPGPPVPVTSTFTAADTTITYTLRIQNGGNGQYDKVTSATVKLNDQQVLSPQDFGHDRTLIEVAVTLGTSNHLEVELRGKPGSGFILDIFGTPSDTIPPTITAEADPPANAQGWNETSVTVTFTCSDSGSGVASCPAARTITIEGAAQLVTGTATDHAGNSATASVTLNIDKTPPTVAVSTSPQPNANGWNTTDVAVTFTCSDSLSGVVTCPGSTTVFTEGADQPLGGMVMDRAGNTASPVGTLNIDKTPPLVTATLSPPANAAGWNNTDVRVVFSCVDAISGVASCPEETTVSVQGAAQAVGTATDIAGNQTVGTMVSLDKTPPVITGFLTPPPNSNGWHGADVKVAFSCADALSGVASCTPATELTTEGADQVVPGVAVDRAGNTANAAARVSLDKTPPIVTAQVVPQPNAAGWNNTDVAVSFEAADALSGIASVTGPVMLTAEGSGQVAAGQAIDRAGNSASAGALINIDKTRPALVLTAPLPGSIRRTPQVEVRGTAEDASPIVSINVAGMELGPESPFATDVLLAEETSQTLTASARDIAGNVGSTSVTLTVTTPPVVKITSPANLSAFGTTPITLSGTVDDPAATVKVGIEETPAQVNGNTWSADGVSLTEGGNVVTATAKDAQGNAGTDSITLILDTTAPRVIVDAPVDSSVTPSPTVTVSGRVSDIVMGTVNSGQARVAVNGRAATVSNRTFVAADVPLSPGINTITVTAVDAVGNSDTRGIVVFRDVAPGPRITAVSGDGQTASIQELLPQPLVVAVDDANGNPLPGRVVIFGVTANDGMLVKPDGQPARTVAITTAGDGTARVRFILGSRAGVANNRVEATTPGLEGAGIFFASGVSRGAGKINVDSGSGQRAVVGQPLPRPFIAVVTDEGHNRLGGVPVTFRVLEGDGHLAGASETTVVTDSDGRAVAVLSLGPREGVANNVVSASIPGVDEPAGFSATALSLGDPAETRLSGVVLDNSNLPIPGVTLRIRGTSLSAASDDQGQFHLGGVPVGDVHLEVDGSTAQRAGTWPNLEFELVTVAGADNTLGMPIFLLALDTRNSIFVDETHGGTLTLPEVPGFSLSVAPNSALFPDGTRRGTLSVTPVHIDKVPMIPNFGQQPRFIVTIQPPGVKFDPPAAVTHPNVEGLRPGQVVELYSFDHDAMSFVATGTATVSEDATVLRSDPGTGIVKGGWHCGGNPSGTGTAHDCPMCKKCVAPNCVSDNSQTPPQRAPDDCKEEICLFGGVHSIPAGETPPQASPEDCRRQVCVLGVVLSVGDSGETPPQNAPDDCKRQSCTPLGFPISTPDTGETPPQNAPDDCKREVCGLFGPKSEDDDGETPPAIHGNCKREYCSSGSPTTAVDDNDFPASKACCDGSVFAPATSCCEATGFFGGREILPKTPVDLDKCVHRVENPSMLGFSNSTDGCSSPFGDDPAGCGFTRFATGNAANPIGCDFHDFCYRTCNPAPGAKADCDSGLRGNLQNICNSLTPAQFTAPAPGGGTCGEKCEFWATKYGQAVSAAGGGAFNDDQKQACQCCP